MLHCTWLLAAMVKEKNVFPEHIYSIATMLSSSSLIKLKNIRQIGWVFLIVSFSFET